MRNSLLIISVVLFLSGCKSEWDKLKDESLDKFIHGQIEESIRLMNKNISENPTDVHAYMILGSIYEDSGRYEDAVGVYKEAIKLDPDSETIHECLGRAYLRTGKITQAIEEYEVLKKLTIEQETDGISAWGLMKEIQEAKAQKSQ
jgi:cytochrome c-type biogenesis protein CcmH/NrfG